MYVKVEKKKKQQQHQQKPIRLLKQIATDLKWAREKRNASVDVNQPEHI